MISYILIGVVVIAVAVCLLAFVLYLFFQPILFMAYIYEEFPVLRYLVKYVIIASLIASMSYIALVTYSINDELPYVLDQIVRFIGYYVAVLCGFNLNGLL
jgi:hypothetical protein